MKTLTILIFLVLTGVSFGSQEGILGFSSFRLESNGIGSSGIVVIEGKQDQNLNIKELKITAFGNTFEVPKEELDSLSGLSANGIRITYEHGYSVLGGRTIYIQLQMGFTVATMREALITLNESGTIEVGRIISKTPNK
jgi:hypothetical protein